jgi:hypothetical protein
VLDRIFRKRCSLPSWPNVVFRDQQEEDFQARLQAHLRRSELNKKKVSVLCGETFGGIWEMQHVPAAEPGTNLEAQRAVLGTTESFGVAGEVVVSVLCGETVGGILKIQHVPAAEPGTDLEARRALLGVRARPEVAFSRELKGNCVSFR